MMLCVSCRGKNKVRLVQKLNARAVCCLGGEALKQLVLLGAFAAWLCNAVHLTHLTPNDAE